jgi:hypothetical protein
MRQQLDDMTPGLTEFITAKTGQRRKDDSK